MFYIHTITSITRKHKYTRQLRHYPHEKINQGQPNSTNRIGSTLKAVVSISTGHTKINCNLFTTAIFEAHLLNVETNRDSRKSIQKLIINSNVTSLKNSNYPQCQCQCKTYCYTE